MPFKFYCNLSLCLGDDHFTDQNDIVAIDTVMLGFLNSRVNASTRIGAYLRGERRL